MKDRKLRVVLAQSCHELGTMGATHNTVCDDKVVPPFADHLDRRDGVGEWGDLVALLKEDTSNQGTENRFIVEY